MFFAEEKVCARHWISRLRAPMTINQAMYRLDRTYAKRRRCQ